MAFDVPVIAQFSYHTGSAAHQKPSPAGERINGHRGVALTHNRTTIPQSRALR